MPLRLEPPGEARSLAVAARLLDEAIKRPGDAVVTALDPFPEALTGRAHGLRVWQQLVLDKLDARGRAGVPQKGVIMLDDLVPRRSVETTDYELMFRLEDGSGGAFAFECDERGEVYLGGLLQIARHSLALCLQGEVDGFRVRPGVVRSSTRSFIMPGSGRCRCGQRVVLGSSWANACETCGREYDGNGLEIADRLPWGEETGESLPDTELGIDPERHG